MKKLLLILSSLSLCASVALADTKETIIKKSLEETLKSDTINIIVEGGDYGIGFHYNSVYGELRTNGDDEFGVGLAYDINGFVFGGSYSDKNHVGTQKGIGAGYTYVFENKNYIGVMGKYTEFDPSSNSYAESKMYDLRALGGYYISPEFILEANAGYKVIDAEDYEKDGSAVGGIGLHYIQPSYNATLKFESDEEQNYVGLVFRIPFGGSNPKTNIAAVASNSVKEFVARSHFDDSMVKAKKVKTTNTADTEAPQLTGTSFTDSNLFFDATLTKNYAAIVSDNVTSDANLTIEIVSKPAIITVTNTGASVTFERTDGGSGSSVVQFRFVDQAGNKSATITQNANDLNDL